MFFSRWFLGLLLALTLLSISSLASSQQFSLTISKAGTGTGTVTGKGSRLKCGSVCSANIDAAKVVTLSAKPAKDSIFAGWSGDADCSDGVVTIDAAKTCIATFTTHNLAVPLFGDGTGTVTSKPGGIKCGTTCSKNFRPGTVLTLTAKAAKGSVFTGWTGACSGTDTCSLSMSSNKFAGAVFDNPSIATQNILEGIYTDPITIPGGGPTLVTVSAIMSETLSFVQDSVTLWRYDDNGTPITNLGRMYDDGTQGDSISGDKIFTKQIVLNESGPGVVLLRVSADVAPLNIFLSQDVQIFVSAIEAPENARGDLASKLRAGNTAEAYNKLGSAFNELKILDNMPINIRNDLADAISTCTVVEQHELVQICVASISVNGQSQELRFFQVKDAQGLWRIIGW